MNIRKEEIHLSPGHPTLLARPDPTPGIYGPVVLSNENVLVDGYRRFFLQESGMIQAVQLPVDSIFEAAAKLNLHSRRWDEIDSLLWTRWANRLGEEPPRSLFVRFPADLLQAPEQVLSFLAQRKISIRQAGYIQRLPERHQGYFLILLSSTLQLNSNESALFLDWVYDLMNRQKIRTPQDLLTGEIFKSILQNEKLNPRQRGEYLLKEMRKLRYPKYQERSVEFSGGWDELDIGDGIRTRRDLFLQRGVLEVTITATSPQEFKSRVKKLYHRLESAGWSRIWKE